MERRHIRADAYVALAALGLAARIALISTSHGGIELEYYLTMARAFSRGEGFSGTGLSNYAPIWAGVAPIWAAVILLVDRGSQVTGVSFNVLMRSLVTGIDLLSAAVLWRLAAARGKDSWKVAGLFLVNPLSIWTTAFQGQFDGLSLLFLLVAILVTSTARGSSAAGWSAIIALTLSIAAKRVTALHPILWLRKVRRPAMLLVPYAATAMLFIPFLGEWRAIRNHVLGYRGVPRSYGLSELVLFDDRFSVPVAVVCLGAAVCTAWFLRWQRDLARSSLFVFLVILFLAPGFGTQYALWALTLGVLTAGAGYFLFTATTIAWTLGSHFGVPGSGRWMGQLVWLSVGFWLLREARLFAGLSAPHAAEEGA